MSRVRLPDDMPRPMRQLPRDSVGRPVPRFVEWIDGKPDFRVMSARYLRQCVVESLCWTCGEKLKRRQGRLVGTFVVGPMCVVNCISAEPPSHADCAEWSAKACPFLNNPDKVRREANLPDDHVDAAGIMIKRNPGVTALVDANWWAIHVAPGGVLFKFRIELVRWIAEGRLARTDQVMGSIESGLPALVELANEEGMGAPQALCSQLRRAMHWVGDVDITQYPTVAETLAVMA